MLFIKQVEILVDDFIALYIPNIMTDDNKISDDQDTLTVSKTETRRPSLYKVLLLNDDFTPMEFVIVVLEKFFGLDHTQSVDIMLTVHKKGVAVIGVFAFEIAETKVKTVLEMAKKDQHPLKCIFEKE